VRADAKKRNERSHFCCERAVVGSSLPALQATVLPIVQGDPFFCYRWSRSDFSVTLSARENPQKVGRQNSRALWNRQ